jgi:hypothetical protein
LLKLMPRGRAQVSKLLISFAVLPSSTVMVLLFSLLTKILPLPAACPGPGAAAAASSSAIASACSPRPLRHSGQMAPRSVIPFSSPSLASQFAAASRR